MTECSFVMHPVTNLTQFEKNSCFKSSDAHRCDSTLTRLTNFDLVWNSDLSSTSMLIFPCRRRRISSTSTSTGPLFDFNLNTSSLQIRPQQVLSFDIDLSFSSTSTSLDVDLNKSSLSTSILFELDHVDRLWPHLKHTLILTCHGSCCTQPHDRDKHRVI